MHGVVGGGQSQNSGRSPLGLQHAEFEKAKRFRARLPTSRGWIRMGVVWGEGGRKGEQCTKPHPGCVTIKRIMSVIDLYLLVRCGSDKVRDREGVYSDVVSQA